MEEILNEDPKIKGSKSKKRTRKREFSRQTFFCVGVSDMFRNKYAIHVLIEKIKTQTQLEAVEIIYVIPQISYYGRKSPGRPNVKIDGRYWL